MLLDADGVLACCLCSLMRPGVEDVETQPMDHENMKRKRTRRDTTRRFSWLRACDVWVRCGCKCGMRQAKLQCEAAAIVRRWRECAQTSEENGVEELWLTQQNFQTFWTTFCLRSPSLDPFSPFPPNRYGQFHIGEPSSGGQAMASLPGPPTSRSADDVEEEQRPETRSPTPARTWMPPSAPLFQGYEDSNGAGSNGGWFPFPDLPLSPCGSFECRRPTPPNLNKRCVSRRLADKRTFLLVLLLHVVDFLLQ